MVTTRSGKRYPYKEYSNRISKRRRRNRYSMNIPTSYKLKRTLRYVEKAVFLDPGVGGVPGVYVFSANGLYDPNITGIGYQPLGFDQYMAMYNHYTVIGAKITVSFVNTADATNLVGITATSTSTVITDDSEAVENGRTNWKHLNASGITGDKQYLTYNLSIEEFMGRKSLLSEDDFRGDVSNNPNEQVYFQLWAAPNSSSDVNGVSCYVVIDYITVFTEPKQLSAS